MDKTFSSFSLYDNFAYLLVGAILIALIGFDARYFFHFNLITADFLGVTTSIVVAYFLGHVVQALANIITATPILGKLLREGKAEFSSEDKEILNDARAYFHREKANDAETFRLCTMLTTANDVAGQIKPFNAYYSLCRGWFVVFLLQSAFSVFALIEFPSTLGWLTLFVSIIIAILMQRRAKRFWNYFRRKVFETFIIIKISPKSIS
jgi:hypothetical protein